jgi:KipI family sensor histidine kinase inhibitor
VRPVGDHAVLLELPSNPMVHEAARLFRDGFGDQLVEVVPGDQTLLLVWDEGVEDAAALMSNLKALAGDASAFKLDIRVSGNEPPPVVTIPVTYDGADLEEVAVALNLSQEAVVELHAGGEYTVAFVGFAPGFPYLRATSRDGDSGVDGVQRDVERLLELPRLATPRTEVPAGSVAVAAGYCGLYPRSSPGGWNLLGRTDVVLFDARREPPALLEPGMRVRFEPV